MASSLVRKPVPSPQSSTDVFRQDQRVHHPAPVGLGAEPNSPVKRVVACVDGTWYDDNGCCNTRFGNNSNVFRLWASIRQGTFVHGNRSVKQVAFYESGTAYAKRPVDSFNDAVTSDGVVAQVDKIFETCATQLSDGTDELWLYGFSRGAYVVQAVADMIHDLSLAAGEGREQYDNRVKKLGAARREPAAKLFDYLQFKGRSGQPAIHMIGLFDSLKVSQTKHDKTFYRSIGSIRHALALTETRRAFQPSPYGPFEDSQDIESRSIIEAWFVGSHADIGGGPRYDGLALYPLQWMMSESIQGGLILDDHSRERNQTITEDPYSLVFPSVPQGDNQETRPIKSWEFRYTNGIHLEMVDLRATHRHGNIKASKGNVLKKKPRLTKTVSKPETKKESPPKTAATLTKEKPKSGFKGLFSRKKKSANSPHPQPPESLVTEAEADQDGTEELVKNPGPRPHTVQINPGAALRSLKSGDRVVFKGDRLIGFIDDAPCGAVIHPSVFFVLDLYNRLGIGESLVPINDALDTFRKTAFMKRKRDTLDPWIAESELGALGRGALKDCRVLVCGRAGVGKSTLINKVFGFPVTQESYDDHGVHDIEEGFARDTFPGLIVHDSKGFQGGATEEVELLERFVKKRASEVDASERLDAIWLCIDVPSTRTIHEADRRIFEVLDQYAASVPIVIVRTMKDRFMNEHLSISRQELRQSGVRGDDLDRLSEARAEEAFARVQEEDINKLERSLNLAKDFAPFIYVAHNDENSIRDLVKKTISLVPDEGACLNLVAAQLVDVGEKINAAIEESVRLLNISNYTAMAGSTLIFGATVSTPTISHVLCHNVVKCFGLTDLKSEEIEKLADQVLWSNLGKFLRQNITTTVLLWGTAAGLTVASGFGGIPFMAGIPFAAVPPAARMVLKCACDIILILTAIFDNKGKAVMRDDFEHASRSYSTKPAKNGLSVRTRVHRDVDALIPTWTFKLHQPLKVTTMRTELRRMVRENRFSLEPNMGQSRTIPAPIPEPGNGITDLQALRDWKEAEAASELPGSSPLSEDLDQWQTPEPAPQLSELTGETAAPPLYSEPEFMENKVLISDPALRRAKDRFGSGQLPEPLGAGQAQPLSSIETQTAELPGIPVMRPVELFGSVPSATSIRRKPVGGSNTMS
ncbi:uncharacterized protein B0I36DRAFT_84926 [Microdochium trichocladiopsis]|uniref:DUF2235 domain-containing protein n=1 Tax=Microdochium trichocladiopsis TaxID=1682393 RepID=A0A9P9BW97_9PEZI|nr:uncharacterized protein B0I36DRAFT_84926 [Microdochium trichocladiopsis]KAH7034861.1 hypothetical protein B0I36DRAFT_84926 [Microdochium trichocladiopsis]